MRKTFILYQYDKKNNDFIYKKEYTKIDEITKDYKLKNNRSIYHYIYDNIDNIKDLILLNNNFIIIKDVLK